MIRAFACLAFATLLSGQSSETAAAFEVADVHVSAPATGANQFMRGGALRGGRLDIRNATMVDLVARAYGVDADLVLGGPSWLEMDRFDVTAKAPAGATPEDAKMMLRALLAERFKLVVHNDTKTVPAWALTAGKHPALKKSEGSGETGCQFAPPAPGAQRPAVQTFSYS